MWKTLQSTNSFPPAFSAPGRAGAATSADRICPAQHVDKPVEHVDSLWEASMLVAKMTR
jgi:hypothetical protein